MPEIEKAIAFDRKTCTWTITGEAVEVRRTEERQAVLDAITAAAEPIGPSDIAASAELKPVNVRKLLLKLVAEGAIEKTGYGKYRRKAGGDRWAAMQAVIAAWKQAVGVGERRTLDAVITMAATHAELAAALRSVAPLIGDAGSGISNVLLARWLRDVNEVAVDGLMLSGGGVDEAGSPYWTLVQAHRG
jgi:hypothetical protein